MCAKRLPDDYCIQCGSLITRERCGKDSRKYCGKPCYFAAIREGKQQFKGRVRDEWAALVDWVYGWDAERPRARKARRRKARPKCQQCGRDCNERSKRFCSRSCNRTWRGKRKCRCGNVVLDASAYSRPSCDECRRQSKRIQKRMYGSYRKRCLAYGGFYNKEVLPKAVFERDKWKCHVCGKKTHKIYQYDDPRSATVDHHPIPLSKGGDHDWHNVRCACSMCNALKGNNWNGQRRLQFAQS